jgi:hypothetical protein
MESKFLWSDPSNQRAHIGFFLNNEISSLFLHGSFIPNDRLLFKDQSAAVSGPRKVFWSTSCTMKTDRATSRQKETFPMQLWCINQNLISKIWNVWMLRKKKEDQVWGAGVSSFMYYLLADLTSQALFDCVFLGFVATKKTIRFQ